MARLLEQIDESPPARLIDSALSGCGSLRFWESEFPQVGKPAGVSDRLRLLNGAITPLLPGAVPGTKIDKEIIRAPVRWWQQRGAAVG